VVAVVVVSVSGAACPPVSAGVVVGEGVVAVLVPVFGVVLGAAVDGTVDEGADDDTVGTVSVGTVSVAVWPGAVVTVPMVFDTSPAGSEPPQPAATPPPAPSARTARTAARRGMEKEEVSDITLYG
jgi:hypothetical protein